MKKTKKILGLVLAAALLAGAAVAGTLAYLQDQADPVTNTFAAANLTEGDFLLKEHEVERGANGEYAFKQTVGTDTETGSIQYTIVPGNDLPKDPFVRVKIAERAYLFLEVIESLPEGMSWNIDDGNWEALMKDDTQVTLNGNKIYMYKGSAATDHVLPAGAQLDYDSATGPSNIIEDQKITVDSGFNAEINEDNKLEFRAYLTQATTFGTPLAAWEATYGAPTP